ncbi:MAG: UvrB/UvrC motif-containing protein [Chlamydiae bacterium]|nr:UvrB/UvrC motif-containing protein [Chlamydiota bacterium]MBI3265892.1 UvrB/UvrC motif-containing protein [Chlamydiota bacterium]
MLCEVCHKKQATVHYTEIIQNKMMKINLCEPCAKEKGIDVYSKFSVADLLSGLADLEAVGASIENESCSQCGMSYREFKEIGRFGCAHCYTTFNELLKPLFEAIHKASRHVGKVPKHWSKHYSGEVELKTLEDQLEKAISGEAFEEAARIRDRIKEVKESKRHVK